MRTARDEEFTTFVREHRGRLVRFATTLAAGDAHLAEDVVQTVLVRVYLARPSRWAELHAYARRAVVNGLIDHRRRSFMRRERVSGDVPERSSPEPADGLDPELMTALAALPPRMRAAVVMRHVEGMSVEETADALDCSTGTVKSQTARGLDKLRTLLAVDVGAAPLVHDDPSRTGDHSCPTS